MKKLFAAIFAAMTAIAVLATSASAVDPVTSLGVADAIRDSNILGVIISEFKEILPMGMLVGFGISGTMRVTRLAKGFVGGRRG